MFLKLQNVMHLIPFIFSPTTKIIIFTETIITEWENEILKPLNIRKQVLNFHLQS